jgi:hypothetical protein
MDQSFKTRIAIIALGLSGLAGSCIAAKMDSIVGAWKLDVSKSKFDPAPAMRKFESQVSATGDGSYAYKSEWVEADGTPGHLEFTTALDGKPVPVSGYAAVDSVKVTKVNAKTLKAVFTKNGKVVERETQTFSADGKTVRDLDTGKDENGKPFNDVLVLERE